jgi:hypothetical protein
MSMRRKVSDIISEVSYSVLDHMSRVLNVDLKQPTKLSRKLLMEMAEQPDFIVVLNVMKLSCECSYELLHALQNNVESKESATYEEWSKLWEEILYKLDFLLVTVHLPYSSCLKFYVLCAECRGL